jgi:hypothetical protein
MHNLKDWFSSSPQASIAFLAACLAAAVTIAVTFFTQWMLARRARTELLTKKLEELYLTLNDISAHNVLRVENALPFTNVVRIPREIPDRGSIVEQQGLDLHKKAIMLVRLYFPQLSTAHQEIFKANSLINGLIYRAKQGEILLKRQLLNVAGDYRDAMVAMEEEIILNRSVLVKDYLLRAPYRSVKVIKTTVPD